jgi:D-ribose pyranose/furanose isomerase RbsD
MNPIIEELKTLKDEIKVQSHLLSMEVKDEFEKMEPQIEQFLESLGESVGEFNEEFWIGNKSEITSLIEDLKKIKNSQK